jgi:small subunit ribosomal protein S6
VKRDYELGFILSPEVSEEETRSILDRLGQIVAQYSGQVVKVNQWGRRRLAYPIERHRDGYYVFIDMILTPEIVTELERTLKVSEIVLRYMLTRRDPKAVQKEREEREEREARAAAAAAAKAEAAQPEAAQPEVVEPETVQPEAVEPVTSEETPAPAETLIVASELSNEELEAAPAATNDSEASEEAIEA